jgi:hypothetical protein
MIDAFHFAYSLIIFNVTLIRLTLPSWRAYFNIKTCCRLKQGALKETLALATGAALYTNATQSKSCPYTKTPPTQKRVDGAFSIKLTSWD